MNSNHLRIAFIGAGFVNFGGGEGPWDHASRLEQLSGLEIVGIADKDEVRATAQLERRRHGLRPDLYTGCGVFSDWREMLQVKNPDAVFIGLPPAAHGKATGDAAVEIGCAEYGVHIFIEKPLSNGDIDQVRIVEDALNGARGKDGQGLIVSVGYMLRYSNMVNQFRHVIEQAAADGRPPRTFSGRYCSAYSRILSPAFWDTRTSGGPIIEQATHFVDLARYLLGEVDLSSVIARTIGAGHPLGELTDMPVTHSGKGIEDHVPPEYRLSRVTVASWRYESGAIGSLQHGLLQHGDVYESELEVWSDGLKAMLTDPYSTECRLNVRDGNFRYCAGPIDGVNDPYLAEDALFIQAIREHRPELIRSPYHDAVRTFELTVRITEEGMA